MGSALVLFLQQSSPPALLHYTYSSASSPSFIYYTEIISCQRAFPLIIILTKQKVEMNM